MVMTNGDSPRTVALLNQKGGVGKTTTTANLGHALAIAGKRVCLIDLDPQGHLTLHLGIDQDAVERTVYDLMVDPDCDVADCVIREARPNLDVMLAEVDLAAAENELASLAERRTILRDRFAPIAHRYDVVLIDCPPSLGLLTVNALTMADELFVPMQAHFLALQGVGRLLETVRLVCGSVNAELTVAGVILCMFERQTTLAKEILVDLEEFFDSYRGADVPWSECRVLQPPIRRNIKLAEAPSFGNTIFDYAPWCPGAIDYRRLAASLLERWGQAVEGFAPAEADDEESDDAAAAGAAGETATTPEPEIGSRTMSVGPGSRGVTSVAPPPAPDARTEAGSPTPTPTADRDIEPETETDVHAVSDADADVAESVAAPASEADLDVDAEPVAAPASGAPTSSDAAEDRDDAIDPAPTASSSSSPRPGPGPNPLGVADPLGMREAPRLTDDLGTPPSSPPESAAPDAPDAPVVEIERTTPPVDETADSGSTSDDSTNGATPRDAASPAST
jgi:chromosome partitioning protein